MVQGEGSRRHQGASGSTSASRYDVGGRLHRISSSQPSTRASISSQSPPSHNRHRAGTSLTQPPQRGGGGGGREDQTPQEDALSTEEIKKLVAEVMRHMLFKSHQQPNVPVRRDELTQLITKTYKQRWLTSTVIDMAEKQLLATFGLQMKEFTRLKSLKASKSASSQVELKYYILQSVVPEEIYKKLVQTPAMAAELGLAVVVVSILKLSGGENVPEETLFKNLDRMGIKEGTDHPVFGNVKTALDTLAKQRYIQKEKLRASEGEEATFAYEVAERALDLSFRDRLDAFMDKIASGSGMSFFAR